MRAVRMPVVLVVRRSPGVGDDRCVLLCPSYVRSRNGYLRHWNDPHELVEKRDAVYIVDDVSKGISTVLSLIEIDVDNNSVTPHSVIQEKCSYWLSTVHYQQ